MNAYYPGTQIKLQAVFKTTAAVETDPTTCRLLYKIPAGTVTAVEMGNLTKATTGTYTYTVTPSSAQAGEWTYRFTSNLASGEDKFKIESVTVST